ncbi:hypothetical protein ACIA48_19855 [Mycobacterium sp. NPDC051804]|uniref:hypothetical protein n=1 Tax=Mycobacterium sp. NPDC051804 TaxID=3364295 RepID=UPI0037B847DD
MSETPTSSEPATDPVASPSPAPPVVREEPRRPRATLAAAWVGIVAGVVFIVAVIFFSGFILGAHSGGHRGHGGPRGDQGAAVFHRGPPPMFPMGPRGEFGPGPAFGPGPGFGPGGPRFESPQPGEPSQPGSTTTPSRP